MSDRVVREARTFGGHYKTATLRRTAVYSLDDIDELQAVINSCVHCMFCKLTSCLLSIAQLLYIIVVSSSSG